MRVLLIDTSSDYLYVSFYDDALKERIFYQKCCLYTKNVL